MSPYWISEKISILRKNKCYQGYEMWVPTTKRVIAGVGYDLVAT